MAVTRNNRGLSPSPPPPYVTHLCRGPSVTNPCHGPLCRILSIGLSRGRLVARPRDSVTSLVAKRPPGPVTSPMFLMLCHITYVIPPNSPKKTSLHSPNPIKTLAHVRSNKLKATERPACKGSQTGTPSWCFAPGEKRKGGSWCLELPRAFN